MSQSSAPILKALSAAQRRRTVGFGAPGHGAGRAAGADIRRLIGRRVFEADLLTPKGLDDRLEHGQVLQKAHALAAQAWGAKLCRFGTGGSTQNLHVALSALAKPGDEVILAANCHKAEFAAAIIGGLRPVVAPVAADDDWDLEHGVSTRTLSRLLDAHPTAKAVVVVSPTYFGVTSDVAALSRLCHDRGMPLLVDAAWGAAFAFSSRLPANPNSQGADVVVVSVHKTMGALGQASAIFVNDGLLDPQRIALAYELHETTSPSVPILASMDATRRDHARHGERIWGRVADLAEAARAELAQVEGVRVLGRERLDGDAAHDLDVTKLTLDISGLGVSAYRAEDWLTRRHNLSLGLSDSRHMLAIFSAGTSRRDADKLVAGIRALSRQARRRPGRIGRPAPRAPHYSDLASEFVMSPAEAFAGPSEMIPYVEAAGRIAAEIIAPAPPGVPRLLPGQRITANHLAFITANLDAGMFVLDPADPRQRKVRVVKPT